MLLKSAKPQDLKKRVQDYLEKSPEVRPFPEVANRLLAACQDPNANAKTFEEIIECDAALASRLLRLANSPIYSPTTKIKSVSRAVSQLGISKMKSLALSAAGASMFASGSASSKQRGELWNHSVGCAIVSRVLASHASDVEAEDAFLGGTFHDVGKLLFFDIIPEEYAQLCASKSGVALTDEEREQLGNTHEEIGLNSAHSWGLPNEIKSAIGWHHRAHEASVYPEIAALVGFADRLAKLWGLGTLDESLEDVVAEVVEFYSMTDEQMVVLENTCRESYDETVQSLSG